MGIGSPLAVVGNTQDAVVQNLALINAVGNELCRQFDWQRITKEYLFTTVFYTYTGNTTAGSASITGMSSIVGLSNLFMVVGVGINQSSQVVSASGSTVVMDQPASASGTVSLTFCQTKYAFPSDYDRLVDRTEWDKSRHWENLGPQTGQQWQWLKSGFISTGPRSRFRPLGGYFQMWPPLSTADLMGFEYVSNQWVLAAADTITPSKASFTVDTDTCVFPDRLMVLGLKSMFFTVKGFANIYEKQYEMQLNIAKANDAGSPTLSMAPRLSDQLITVANIPDSGYGS